MKSDAIQAEAPEVELDLGWLDPKYDKLIDQAARKNLLSDPNRHLSKMKPFKSRKPLTE